MGETVHWRLHCATEDAVKYWRLKSNEAAPTTCPTDTAHAVTAGSVVESHRSGPKTVHLDGPETSDRTPIFQPAVFRGDVIPYYTGTADDAVGGTRGDGAAFKLQRAAAGDSDLQWQFVDALYIYSGKARIWNGADGDHVSFELVAPATDVVANTDAGNCDLVALGGGANKIVDAPGSDGSHDVNVTEALNANLDAKSSGAPTKVTKAVPVPALNADGLPIGDWDWDQETGAITPNTGAGAWYLFDFEKVLIRWVNRLQVFNPAGGMVEEVLEVPVKSKKILPHWKFKASLHTTQAQTVDMTWKLVVGRAETT